MTMHVNNITDIVCTIKKLQFAIQIGPYMSQYEFLYSSLVIKLQSSVVSSNLLHLQYALRTVHAFGLVIIS